MEGSFCSKTDASRCGMCNAFALIVGLPAETQQALDTHCFVP